MPLLWTAVLWQAQHCAPFSDYGTSIFLGRPPPHPSPCGGVGWIPVPALGWAVTQVTDLFWGGGQGWSTEPKPPASPTLLEFWALLNRCCIHLELLGVIVVPVWRKSIWSQVVTHPRVQAHPVTTDMVTHPHVSVCMYLGLLCRWGAIHTRTHHKINKCLQLLGWRPGRGWNKQSQ